MSTISTLNHLIETLKDGQEGFRAASEDIGSSELKTLFSKYSLQRAQFAGELQEAVITLGDHDPADSGSVAGAVHRGWIDLKAALMSKDEHAVLAECERGEDVAVAAYRKALERCGLMPLISPPFVTATGEGICFGDSSRIHARAGAALPWFIRPLQRPVSPLRVSGCGPRGAWPDRPGRHSRRALFSRAPGSSP